VEGTNLNKLLIEIRLSDTARASICQHEQQVMEISAQLMQVCKSNASLNKLRYQRLILQIFLCSVTYMALILLI